MGRLDNEENVIKDMHKVTSNQIMLLSGSKFEKRLIGAIMKEWPKWTANNGHACEPPDYFSRDHRLMFDVSWVNDSEISIITKHGKRSVKIRYSNESETWCGKQRGLFPICQKTTSL